MLINTTNHALGRPHPQLGMVTAASAPSAPNRVRFPSRQAVEHHHDAKPPSPSAGSSTVTSPLCSTKPCTSATPPMKGKQWPPSGSCELSSTSPPHHPLPQRVAAAAPFPMSSECAAAPSLRPCRRAALFIAGELHTHQSLLLFLFAVVLVAVIELKSAFVPCALDIAGILEPHSAGHSSPSLENSNTTSPVHLCVRPSCHGCLHAGRGTPCFLLGTAAPYRPNRSSAAYRMHAATSRTTASPAS
jgi:hypothetical protein